MQRTVRLLIAPALAAFVCAVGLACGSDATTTPISDDGSAGDGTTSADGSTGALDASSSDANAATDAADGGPFSYGDIADMSRWQTFDVSTLDPALASGNSYESAAFDGRYVYFVPYDRNVTADGGAQPSGVVLRLDTTVTFDAAAWSVFDITTVNADATRFLGAAFDGRYLHLIAGASSLHTEARYDTHGGFADGASWSFTQRPQFRLGAAFDGKNLYVPATLAGGSVDRFDTTGAFDGGGWTTFDVHDVNPEAGAFGGAFFDGRFAYFVPENAAGATPSGIVPRFDTQGSFADAASWEAFDLGVDDNAAKGFLGGVFDGRYAYFVPNRNSSAGPDGVIARYDTQNQFASASAWTTFDVTGKVNPNLGGFAGGVFDGRYVYFVPTYADAIGRYDTAAAFTDPASWSMIKATTIHPNATHFHGGAFDGRYVYFVPGLTSIVLRFDAKSPPALPASYHGSFL